MLTKSVLEARIPVSSSFFTNNMRSPSLQIYKQIGNVVNLKNSVRPLFYYSNALLNPSRMSFTNNNATIHLNKSLHFFPNLIISNAEHKRTISQSLINNSRDIDAIDKSMIAKVAKSTLACHPNDASNNHIPFEVKPKTSKPVVTQSVLQRFLAGEKLTPKQLINPYMALTKPQLTFLIMLSSICSYALAPNSASVFTFLFLTSGTILTSSAANAINMAREPEFDKQMARTSTRPVVTGLVTPTEAYGFAALTSTVGCALLYYGVNPTVAVLGGLNIVLYSWLYTSLKRKSILNTWVGAIVGAIPPLMGWAACSSLSDPGAWCLAALLYAWQFPHFNALSHNIKDEYKRAGYVMTAFVNPKLNARVALRYSFLMFPICFGMCYFGVTDYYYMLDSSLLNGWLTYMAFKFWWQTRQNNSAKVLSSGGPTKEAITAANVYAKKTFWGSVWQLPVVLLLAMLHKKGQWDRLFGWDQEDKLEA
ncbi:hypothetical protein B5S28_g3020 [[Candida] boidinii]|uniref:Unnamed protein product n=1 Tax=Candida boidinii TaxID=5477 RepID=A0ACB5TS37_CANBO|nr:hypothetical protein B5S28_g3020 [[Candida] boidinii]OWB62531.1 hypothetical protein B5S29_g3464 [[Candida] boidinii]OWB72356.1 hypothetical protein B5S31_g2063 [[Candida] boidinii]OWB79350.1 hypothetical protein B5S32_g3570 [[Candida] boidinii]GME93737.1 unnamed protein product [[Candida] boidinii]